MKGNLLLRVLQSGVLGYESEVSCASFHCGRHREANGEGQEAGSSGQDSFHWPLDQVAADGERGGRISRVPGELPQTGSQSLPLPRESAFQNVGRQLQSLHQLRRGSDCFRVHQWSIQWTERLQGPRDLRQLRTGGGSEEVFHLQVSRLLWSGSPVMYDGDIHCMFSFSQTCQKFHWFVHKKHCDRLRREFEKREAANKKLEEKKQEN